jgi:hypothetical protein
MFEANLGKEEYLSVKWVFRKFQFENGAAW